MFKIVIINAVPINGGDEALLKATLLGLKKQFNNPSILVLCNNPNLYKKFFPNLELDWDWEYTHLKSPNSGYTFLFKVKRRIRHLLNKFIKVSYYSTLSRMFASKSEKRVYKHLSGCDKVIVSAGGYIHDFYGYKKRIDTLDFIHFHLKKPYFIFSQSVGPFWKKENFQMLNRIFKNANQVILRESYSLNHLKSIGYNDENVTVTNDIAFYLYKDYARKVDCNKELKNIVINFRKWKYEDKSKDNLEKATLLCKKLINKGFKLTFISTCQGVKGYVDDSEFAERILNNLPIVLQTQCVILKDKFTLKELLETLSQYDGYIGMRLHGAILSLLAGIPALNIAYEDKTLGIFDSLGLEDYCFSYKEDINSWFSKVDFFINNYNSYLNNIDIITLNASKQVEKNFKLLKLNRLLK
ncbi:polysaccharide pyruvyl transferase family protein [uncultured Lutibacter sp.]|uniref:polysaccharide pyruvyl transferase family protein n=1 Tax=uncultured Lutibacter sp. TaxID=437739 RepID=UPI00260A0FC1|nr:polysaccharide pyruvyl transferase family protein [uncultured Lutibacter sp.]